MDTHDSKGQSQSHEVPAYQFSLWYLDGSRDTGLISYREAKFAGWRSYEQNEL